MTALHTDSILSKIQWSKGKEAQDFILVHSFSRATSSSSIKPIEVPLKSIKNKPRIWILNPTRFKFPLQCSTPLHNPQNNLFCYKQTCWKPYPAPHSPVEPYYSENNAPKLPPRCLTYKTKAINNLNHKEITTANQKSIKKDQEQLSWYEAVLSKWFRTRLAY